jgi:phosphate transport system permease protein
MAVETAAEREADGGFGRISRTKGLLFRYLTFGASVVGIVALAVLLAYVFWDAFGLADAEAAWYGVFAATVVAPVIGFGLYTRRNPLAGEVALELVSTTMAGVLGGFGLVAILAVIAGPGVWFAYFLTIAAPLAALYVYNRHRTEVNWAGIAALGVLIVGPVVGTLALGPLGGVAAAIGPVAVYAISLVVPTALVVRYVVNDRLELWNGAYAAAAVVGVALLGVPVVGRFTPVPPDVWLLFVTTLVAPLGIVVGKTLADRDRWAGLAGPGALAGGAVLLVVATEAPGIAGPQPWFDWRYVTSSPSRFADQAGLYPAIIGSVFIIVLVALITLLLGVGAAVYLEEYAPDGGRAGAVTRLIRINISNLAGVPSVVYGILGLAVFARLARLGVGTVITAAFTLSLLILPIVIIAAREAIDAVPDSLRDASYGMGATRWQTTRNVVLPRAIPGILTGTILALGRAIGETAPLIIIGVSTTQFSPPAGLFSVTTAMPMQVFTWATFPSKEFQHGVVAAGVVTLLIVLLTMNSIAILLRNRFEGEPV